jgi:hypothetical protein
MPSRTLPLLLFPFAALFLGAAAVSQSPAHNKIEFGNWWVTQREDLWPNYRSNGGNVAGDGLFKIYPQALLERGAAHRISGYALGVSVDDGYQGTYPVTVDPPDVVLYRTQRVTQGGKTFEIPDLAGGPIGPVLDTPAVSLTSDDFWLVEVKFTSSNLITVPAQVNGQTTGLCMMLLAPAGARQADRKAWPVCFPSDAELHRAPGYDAYSGSYNAQTNQILMYGQTGAPSNTGELFAQLRFDNATLQLRSDSSGGFRNDPNGFETHLGPGAYDTDLASRGGWLGLYVQSERHEAAPVPTHLCLPLIVSTRFDPVFASTTIDSAVLRLDQGFLNLVDFWLGVGAVGPIARYGKASGAGFDQDQTGVYASPKLSWPKGVGAGAVFWTQAVVLDLTTFRLVEATNVVRFTAR